MILGYKTRDPGRAYFLKFSALCNTATVVPPALTHQLDYVVQEQILNRK